MKKTISINNKKTQIVANCTHISGTLTNEPIKVAKINKIRLLFWRFFQEIIFLDIAK